MLRITENYEGMSRASAELVMEVLAGKSDAVIGLAAGNSQKGMYAILAGLPDFLQSAGKAHFFNIDEYCNISLDRPGTCRYFIFHHLIRKANLPEDRIFLLNQKNFADFGALLDRLKGVDLMILGVGKNGHIAYNEPGTPFGSGIHLQPIAAASKLQHGLEFGGVENIPDTSVTCGIKTIMRSRRILLMASGRGKAEIMKASLLGPVTPEVPCSVLQLHPNVDCILDRDAASLL